MAEGERFAQRELEHGLGAGRERDLAGRHLVALADDTRDRDTRPLAGQAEPRKNSSGDPLFLTEQPEEQVLGPDVVVPERARLVLREDDDLPRPLGETLEQEPRA